MKFKAQLHGESRLITVRAATADLVLYDCEFPYVGGNLSCAPKQNLCMSRPGFERRFPNAGLA